MIDKHSDREYGTTAQFAELNGIKPETALRSFCQKGSYFGVVPKKRPNGRLIWELISLEESSTSNQEVAA